MDATKLCDSKRWCHYESSRVVSKWKRLVYLYIVIDTAAGRALQLEGSKGVVDGVPGGGLDGPAALSGCWVVVGKVKRLHHSSVAA